MGDEDKKHEGVKPTGSHSHGKPMTMAESLEAHRRFNEEVAARQRREAEAFRTEILARKAADEFIGPVSP